MVLLVFGLLLFLGMHSSRMLFPTVRNIVIENAGKLAWKGIYSLISIAGLIMIIVGYGQARQAPVWIWYPPLWLNHATALLMLFSFVFLVATYIPRNHIKAAVGHPMLLAVKIWAVAHLLSNPTLADSLLFGGFLLWALLLFKYCKNEDRAAMLNNSAENKPKAKLWLTLLTVITGVAGYVVFALVLHKMLIGVAPFG
ncbi:MAG: NnrU family protein [Oleibacter sp.]|nr:NnrU family protein [Thalassolituus sp.]